MMNETRITGGWLTLARFAWVMLAIIYLGANLATLPSKLTETIQVEIMTSSRWTPAQTQSAFAELSLRPESYGLFIRWSDLLLQFVYFGLAAFLFARQSDDRMAYLLSVIFLVSLGTGNFEKLAQIYSQPIWNHVEVLSNSVSSTLLLSIFFVFPDGRFAPGWTRWVALAFAAIQAWRIFFPDQYDAIALLLVPVFIVIPISLLYRYFRVSNLIQRQQIKWVVFGLAIVLIPLSLYGAILGATPELDQPGGASLTFFFMGTSLWIGFLIVFPITLMISVIRYRLFDIDIIIRRTLQYTILTGLLVLSYFGSVVLLQNLFFRNQQSEITIVLSTLGIAALFNPLRNRVQDFIDRRFYRKKYNAELALAKFAATARDEVDMDKLTAALIGVVQETVQPERVSIWLKDSGKGRREK